MTDQNKKEITTIVKQVLKETGGLQIRLAKHQRHRGGHPETGRRY